MALAIELILASVNYSGQKRWCQKNNLKTNCEIQKIKLKKVLLSRFNLQKAHRTLLNFNKKP